MRTAAVKQTIRIPAVTSKAHSVTASMVFRGLSTSVVPSGASGTWVSLITSAWDSFLLLSGSFQMSWCQSK